MPINIWFNFHCNNKQKITSFPIKISFMIYSMHDILIRIIGWFLNKVDIEKVFAGYQVIFMRFIIVILVYLVVLIITYIINGINPKLYKILTGGR